VVRHLYAYIDDPGPNVVFGIQLSSPVFQPSLNGSTAGVANRLVITLSNGTSVVWDGRTDGGNFVGNGQYLVEAHSFDGQGGETTVTQEVSVLGPRTGNGLGQVAAVPNVVDGAKGNTSVLFQVEGSSAGGLTLKVDLYDLAGELVKTLEGPPGGGYAVWNAQGVASGVYLARATLLDSQGKNLTGQTLKVLVRH
jgi:hypothetical protein